MMVAMTPAAKPMPRAAEGDSWSGSCIEVADADADAIDVEAELREVVEDSVMIAGMVAIDIAMVDRYTRFMRPAKRLS
jgi:hypothetical protein